MNANVDMRVREENILTKSREQERWVREHNVKHTKAEYLTAETIIDLLGGFSRL